MNRLKEKYLKEITPKLKEEFGIKNVMAIPKVTKVVINMGIGDALKSKDLKETLSKDIALICGQKPALKLAKLSVAGFGIRAGMPVGLAVTVRGERMYAFLDRLFSIVLPRLRDFRGLPEKSLDRKGNYTLGISEHTVFPEIDPTKSSSHGFEITIVTNANDRKKAYRFLQLLGLPFAKKE